MTKNFHASLFFCFAHTGTKVFILHWNCLLNVACSTALFCRVLGISLYTPYTLKNLLQVSIVQLLVLTSNILLERLDLFKFIILSKYSNQQCLLPSLSHTRRKTQGTNTWIKLIFDGCPSFPFNVVSPLMAASIWATPPYLQYM